MKNKKAFTIIELLAVILLISLLMIVVIPSVVKFMKKGTESYYRSLESELKTAGADYVETYRSLLPQNIGHVRVIELDELENNNYIDPVLDEKKNECIGQVTIEKVKTDSYKYYSCIKCGDYYTSEGEYCIYDSNLGKFENKESENVYTDTSDYEIRVEKDNYEVNQTEDFVSPLAEVYYKGQLIKSDLEGSPTKIDTNSLGETTVVYYYHGAKKNIKVNVIDNINPSKTQVVLKYENDAGTDYKGQWYSGNIYVQYKATDYTVKGIKGAGIDHYEVSSDGVNFVSLDSENQEEFKKISKTEQQMIKEGNYVRYVRAVDKDGNIGPVNSYRIKIDKTKPTCSFAGESTDWQPNLNLPENERVTSRTIVATCSDSVSDCTEATKSKTWVETTTNKTKYLSYTIVDLAGNSKLCEKTVNVYLDKQKPTISAKDIALGSQDYNFVSNTQTTCGPSGCTTVCDPANSLKTGTYVVTCTITSTVGLSATTTFTARHSYPATYNHKICTRDVNCHDGECCDETVSCDPWTCDDWAACCPSANTCGCHCTQAFGYTCCKRSHRCRQCDKEDYDCSYYTCPKGGNPIDSTCYY